MANASALTWANVRSMYGGGGVCYSAPERRPQLAKTTAPLLSFGAAGQIGKTQVYAVWKGRSYARRYTTPANPRSTEQTLTRDTFSWLQQVYKFAPAAITNVYELYAKGKVLTARNAFTRTNLSGLREASDLTNFMFSPGALGGPPPIAVGHAGGSGTITQTVDPPAVLPTGWTITAAWGACIRDQDPQSGILYQTYAASDATSPYAPVISGLTAGEYWAQAWLEWLRPDGLIAYSPSLGDFVTVT